MHVIDLTGLPIADAVALAGRRLDQWFAAHLVQQRALMLYEGLSRDVAEDMLDRQKAFYRIVTGQAVEHWRGNSLTIGIRMSGQDGLPIDLSGTTAKWCFARSAQAKAAGGVLFDHLVGANEQR
jgi:hypothetical protein